MVSNLLWQPTAIKLLLTNESPEERQDRRLQQARVLCRYAQNRASWRIADRLAQSWLECGCADLGCPAPAEEATRVRRG
jgi:hypothetical protein